MTELVINLETIISGGAIAAAILSIDKLIKLLKEPKKKDDEEKQMIKDRIDEIEVKLNADFVSLQHLEKSNELILQSLFVMIDHDITQNGYPELEKARNKLHKFLITKNSDDE